GKGVQPVRTVGNDDVLDLGGDETGRAVCAAYWPADREHAGVHPGWERRTCAGGGSGRDLYRGCGSGARVSEPGAIDGGTLSEGPVWERSGRTDVPDRGPREMAFPGNDRVPGKKRLPGEGAWLPDRAGRD